MKKLTQYVLLFFGFICSVTPTSFGMHQKKIDQITQKMRKNTFIIIRQFNPKEIKAHRLAKQNYLVAIKMPLAIKIQAKHNRINQLAKRLKKIIELIDKEIEIEAYE